MGVVPAQVREFTAFSLRLQVQACRERFWHPILDAELFFPTAHNVPPVLLLHLVPSPAPAAPSCHMADVSPPLLPAPSSNPAAIKDT